jgi:hypothetical protein
VDGLADGAEIEASLGQLPDDVGRGVRRGQAFYGWLEGAVEARQDGSRFLARAALCCLKVTMEVCPKGAVSDQGIKWWCSHFSETDRLVGRFYIMVAVMDEQLLQAKPWRI